MPYEIKMVETLEPAEWVSLLEDNYVLFIGSAVSIWEPTAMTTKKYGNGCLTSIPKVSRTLCTGPSCRISVKVIQNLS